MHHGRARQAGDPWIALSSLLQVHVSSTTYMPVTHSTYHYVHALYHGHWSYQGFIQELEKGNINPVIANYE